MKRVEAAEGGGWREELAICCDEQKWESLCGFIARAADDGIQSENDSRDSLRCLSRDSR